MQNPKALLNQARGLAQQLASQQVDVNEVEKVLAYALRKRDLHKTVEVIHRLATQEILVYSNRTQVYARALQQTLSPALQRAENTDSGLQLLGWVARFMRYEAARKGQGSYR